MEPSPKPSPLAVGIRQGMTGVAGASACFAIAALAADLTDPSAQVFRDLAQVEVGLFIAFSVAIAGVGLRGGKSLEDHLSWLGFGCGIGLSALIGIALSIALASYREAGHASALDILGLCWVTTSTLMLGITVALLPYATFNWKQPAGPSVSDSDAQ